MRLIFSQWKIWRDHVSVLICFTVYCGIIDTYLHKIYHKCGFVAVMEREV